LFIEFIFGMFENKMLTKTTYCFFLLLLSCSVYAQQQDSLLLQNQAQNIFQKTDSLGKKLSTDTLSLKAKKKIARLQAKKQRTQQKVEKFKNENRLAKLQNQANQKMDSLNPQNRINQSISKVEHLKDSLVRTLTVPPGQLARYQQKMDSVQGRLSAKVDSLRNFKLPEIRLTKSIDSLKQKIDSLKTKGLFRQARKAEKKLAGLQEKTNATLQSGQQKITSLQKGVNEKLDLFNKEGGKLGNANLPNVNSKLPNLPSVGNSINVPQLNTNLPNVNVPQVNTKLGNVNLPSVGNSKLPNANAPMPNAQVPNTNLSAPNLKDVGLGDVGKGLNDVSNSTKEIGKYTEGVKNFSADGLNDEKLKKEMEANAANMAGGKALQTQLTDIEKQKAMVEKWNSDPEYRKEMAVNQAKEQAVNHFAGKEKELMAAMDQLSKAKTKVKDAEQVVDLFKKPANPMKGKPFVERLRPGINLQIQSRQNIMVDFNPQIGYRISGRFAAGIGWNERISFNSKKSSVNFDDRVYGPRSYAQVKVKGGSYGLLNAECMNAAFVPPSGEATRQWVWSYMAGYKQEFRISNKLLGNVQIMYTFYTSYYQSPYVDKLNIRIGFEFPQKRKPTKKI
jgi:hypothetical protein